MRKKQTRNVRRSPKVPHGNRNHTGWWIASFIERFEYYDENKANLNRRCLAWENTILIKAPNREVAYRKAVVQGRLSNGNEGVEFVIRAEGDLALRRADRSSSGL